MLGQRQRGFKLMGRMDGRLDEWMDGPEAKGQGKTECWWQCRVSYGARSVKQQASSRFRLARPCWSGLGWRPGFMHHQPGSVCAVCFLSLELNSVSSLNGRPCLSLNSGSFRTSSTVDSVNGHWQGSPASELGRKRLSDQKCPPCYLFIRTEHIFHISSSVMSSGALKIALGLEASSKSSFWWFILWFDCFFSVSWYSTTLDTISASKEN